MVSNKLSFLISVTFLLVGLIKAQDTPIVKEVFSVNTEHLENSVNITKDAHFMILSSTRPGVLPFSSKNDFNLILFYRADVTSDDWEYVRAFEYPINTRFNSDYGDIKNGRMVLELWHPDWKEKEEGPFFVSDIRFEDENIKVTNLRPIGKEITRFMINHGYEATDGITLLEDNSIIFASGKKYYGNMNLFYAKNRGNYQYDYPVPLSVNTEAFDERTPFMSGDNFTLFFASDRSGTLGKLDLFSVRFENGNTLKKVEHFPAPINSEDEEKGYVNYTETEGFFVRNEDVYRVTNLPSIATTLTPTIIEEQLEKEANVLTEIDEEIIESEGVYEELDEIPVASDSVETVEDKCSLKEGEIIFSSKNNVVFLLDNSNSMDEPDKLFIDETYNFFYFTLFKKRQ
jgi:hypothetical protein